MPALTEQLHALFHGEIRVLSASDGLRVLQIATGDNCNLHDFTMGLPGCRD